MPLDPRQDGAASPGDQLRAISEIEGAVVVRGEREAVAAQTKAIKDAVRVEVGRVFTGGKRTGKGAAQVAGAIRGKIAEDHRGTAGLVYSKFGRRDGGRYLDYLLPHALGLTQRPRDGGLLFVPLDRNNRRLKEDRAFGVRRVFLDPRVDTVPLPEGGFLVVRRAPGKRRPHSIGEALALLLPAVEIEARLDISRVVTAAPKQLADRLIRGMALADNDLRRARYQEGRAGRAAAGERVHKLRKPIEV